MKTCTKCQLALPLEAFSVKKAKKDGMQCWCKSCRNAAMKAYNASPEGKAYWKARYAAPEYKAYNKARNDSPEYKAYYKARRDTPEGKAYTKAHNAAFNASPEGMRYQHERGLKRKYGMTSLEYGLMYQSQNGLCACCKDTLDLDKSTHVDHDHLTGQVRGLLCHDCNVGLGHFRDSPDRLAMAIEYLKASGNGSSPLGSNLQIGGHKWNSST